jgi:hypothetical protein
MIVSERTGSRKGDSTNIEIISNAHHWCIAASTLAFHLNESKFAILGRLSRLDSTKVLLDGIEDVGRAVQHAGCCRANLDKVLADRFA